MQKKSLNSSQNNWNKYPYTGSLDRFVDCVRQLDPVLVLLFGSVAKGDFTQYSDADVLVVFEQPVVWEKVYACSNGVVQPVVKTLPDLLSKIKAGEPFYCEMISEGKILINKKLTMERLTQALEDTQQHLGLERTASGWRWGKK